MSPVIIINIFTSVVVSVVGIMMLVGLIPGERNTRLILGVIFIGYGIFRFLNVKAKLKVKKQNEMREEMKKKTEELIHKK